MESLKFFDSKYVVEKIFVGKVLIEKNFDRKNKFSKNIFSRPKKILWKSQWKMKILKFQCFRLFRRKNQISKFAFFIDFFIGFFFENFLISKNIFRFFDNIFWSWKFLFFCGFFSISTQNFIRNPKIILRKSCEHHKIV